MLLCALITVSVGILFYYFIVKPYSYWSDRGVKQGNPKWLVGDNWGTVSGSQSFTEMVKMLYDRFPHARYTGIYQFLLPTLLIRDPDLIKLITMKDFDHFTDHRSFVPETTDPLWGKNLLALKGQRWREMRTLLSPSFTSSKMKGMFVLMSDCADNFVQHFLKKNEDVVTVDLKDTFTRYSNDVIATAAFGIKVDSLGQPENEFYLMGKEATEIKGFLGFLKIFGFFFFPKLYDILKIGFFSAKARDFFQNLVFETIKVREEKGIVRPDMLNLLMEAKRFLESREEKGTKDSEFVSAQESDLGKSKLPKQITNMDIAAQAIAFFFGGFETVSSALCFIVYELAANPDVQDRLREEVRQTLDKCDGKITYEGVIEMKYLDMVVSETLRKWPISAMINRVCTRSYTIDPITPDEKPLYIEKETEIWLSLYGIHRDPQYYPDPERFDPERFSDENKDHIKPYTYFPFGLGPRSCIGSRFALMECKVIICYILKVFEIIPVEKSTIPLKLSKKEFGMTSEGGFWFGLKRSCDGLCDC